MLGRIPFKPKNQPTNEAAKAYIPKFIYGDPKDPSVVDIKEDFYGSRRKLRIGIVGAGISCIDVLHHLEEAIPSDSVEIIVYEKNHDVGGVWLTSRYPGCRCDIPGPSYQFTWRQNVWTEFMPPAKETCEYVQTVARENNFYQLIKFQHKVIAASWTDEDGKWTLTIEDLATGTTFEDKVDLFSS